MKAKSPPRHDPDLGAKFLSEYGGLVIGRGRSSQPSSEDDSLLKYQDPQEVHDEQLPNPPTQSSSAHEEVVSEEEERDLGALRLARFRHQNEEFKRLSREANKKS